MHLTGWFSGALYSIIPKHHDTKTSCDDFWTHQTRIWLIIRFGVFWNSRTSFVLKHVGKALPISLSGCALYLYGIIQHRVTLAYPSFTITASSLAVQPLHRVSPRPVVTSTSTCCRQAWSRSSDTAIHRHLPKFHYYSSLKGGLIDFFRDHGMALVQ